MRAQRLSAIAVGTLTALGPSMLSAVAAASPASAGDPPTTEVAVESSPTDYPVLTWTGQAVPPVQTVAVTGVQNASTSEVTANVSGLPGGGTFSVMFANTENGAPLAAGTTYNNATYSPTGTAPVLELDGGAEYQTGSFTIDQLAWSGGALTQFEAHFRAVGFGGQTVQGLVRYNATGPAPAGAATGLPPTAPSGSVAPITFRRGQAIISNPGSGVGGTQIATVPLPASGIVPAASVNAGDTGRTAWTPLGTRLLTTSGPDISSVRPDGSARQPVTGESAAGASLFSEPAVSPDGSFMVAFTPGTGLVSFATDGSQAGHGYPLPLGPASTHDVNCQGDEFPSIAPDYSVILQCDKVTGPPDTYRFANGSTTLLIANAAQATYSPDGTRIVFVRNDANGIPQLFSVGADGRTGLAQITQERNGATKPAWSPDGRYLAYENPVFHEIVEIPAGGGAAVGSIPDADDPTWTAPTATTHVVREWGPDRHATAIAASQLNFANHGDTADRKRTQAGAVVLARDDNFADALGGSALAVRENAPLLVTPTGSLNAGVAAEISRVLAPGGKVYLLGGTAALSPAVAEALAAKHFQVERLAGSTRYATAAAIAHVVDPHPRMVIVATGADFPDALSAGATGLPVLLTEGATMPADTAAYLNRLNPDPNSGGTQLITVGGPGDKALISGYQHHQMPSWPGQISRIPLAGSTRYATSLMVAQAFFGGETDAAVATGLSWPDALSGGAMVGHRGGPLLLTNPTGMSPALLGYLGSESSSLYALHLLGGPAALPNIIALQGAGVIGVPGHVSIDSLEPGGVVPLSAHLAVEPQKAAGTARRTSGATGATGTTAGGRPQAVRQ
jgi:putative cell wall-binding protein